MVSVQSIGNNNLYQLNFRADNKQSKPNDPPMLVRQQRNKQVDSYEQERKKQKTKSNILTGLTIASSAALILLAVVSIASLRKGGAAASDNLRSATEKEALKLKPVDLDRITLRPDESYSPEVLQYSEDFINRLKRGDIVIKGGKLITRVQLAGPGGTGKTDAVHCWAVKLNKIFPGSELYKPDLSMLSSSSYQGQDVQMLTEYTNALCKRAEELLAETKTTGKKKFMMVFLDEIDKIAMVDNSIHKSHSNKTIGALKTLINDLNKYDNVMIVSATNYPELIEDAVASRTAQKVTVDYLNSRQIITTITEHFKTKKMIADEMKDITNPKLKKICDILGTKEHKMEFRKLYDDVLDNTILASEETGNVDIQSFAKALTKESTSRNLHLTPEEAKNIREIAELAA